MNHRSKSGIRSDELLDVVLAGGVVVDGTGAPRYPADVGIADYRIAAVGDLAEMPTTRREDVSGLVLCPGFVDIHAHSDVMTLAFPEGTNKIHQGITTEIAGNCGLAVAPLRDDVADEVRALATLVDVPGTTWDWTSVGGYLDRVDASHPAVNVALLAGHLAIRVSVMGTGQRPPTASELDRMRAMLERALGDGAVGMSLGLMYPPSSYAPFEEMVALGETLAEHNALLAVHLRDYSDGLLDAVDEALAVAAAAGCRLQISHLTASGKENWGTVEHALERIDTAAANGVDVATDMYPYLAGSTNLSQLMPRWALDGGMEALRARVDDAQSRQRIADALIAARRNWDEIVLGFVPSDPTYNGTTVADLAIQHTRRPEVVVMDLLAMCDPTIISFGRSPSDLRAVFAHPRAMVGSDGLVVLPDDATGGNLPHPRSFGTYPGFLRRHVLDDPLVSLEEGIRMCTSAPADRVQLSGRGRIAEGAQADLVVLDLNVIDDMSTYERPRQLPRGIRHVIVGGVPVVRDGRATGNRGGRALRDMLQ